MDRRYFLASSTAWAALSGSARSAVVNEPELQIRARIGPWPVISRLIAYNGRLWFANSVKGRNHNSADIWSLDPSRNDARYERHLFTQDAGKPLIHNGLLYWPFEDSRFSIGWGMLEVTDGKNWQPAILSSAEIFHTSSLVEWNDRITAVTGAWRFGLQVSNGAGYKWHELYNHPTPDGQVSRFHHALMFKNELYGQLSDSEGVRLVKFVENRPVHVPGWPVNRFIRALTRHKEWIFAVIRIAGGYQIWQTDGHISKPVSQNTLNVPFVDLTNDGERLWAVSKTKGGGQLWSSPDGANWLRQTRFSGGQPLSLNIIEGKIYVAGAGNDDRGIIWGPALHHLSRTYTPAIPTEPHALLPMNDNWERVGAGLEAVMAEVSQYQDHGRGMIRKQIYDAVRYGPPPGFFSQRLKARFPSGRVQAFAGKMDVKMVDMAQSYLLWGMGLAKQKDIPLSFIRHRWQEPVNSFEKYFNPQLAAIWAIMVTGQKDLATIDSLVDKVSDTRDPLWLRRQVSGTLSTLTGRKVTQDNGDWRKWWATARVTWSN